VLINAVLRSVACLRVVSRDVIPDEMWAVVGPLFPRVAATARPPVGRPQVVEATAWRYRTGAPWRDLRAAENEKTRRRGRHWRDFTNSIKEKAE
jgi:transposase